MNSNLLLITRSKYLDFCSAKTVARVPISCAKQLYVAAFRGEKVIAVASMNMDPIVARAAEVMLCGNCITKAEVTG